MRNQDYIPEFAVIGHPNEGKSSVVSTLAEDDRVRIGPTPGETVVCQTFPVIINGREIIRFTDTPGFQNPRQTLDWMRQYKGPDERILDEFIKAHGHDADFRDECELFKPVARGAGVIYVVDGSRPLRNVDRIEMEILRISGRPRMSVINCKGEEPTWLEQWKNEFRKHFNAIRIFNAHKATYAERIDLLESLKRVDQDWQPALSEVIRSFKQDWKQRNVKCTDLIVGMLEEIFSLSVVGNLSADERSGEKKSQLERTFRRKLEMLEKNTHRKIRSLFKHNIFDVDLPGNSILKEQLFSEKTWMFLGLKPREVALAAGIAGGAAGAVIDVAAAGLTFGIFSAIGGAVGYGSALLSGRRVADIRIKGLRLGKDQIKIGPLKDLQFMFVLLDRVLIYYGNIINWAHARQDGIEDISGDVSKKLKQGITADWNDKQKMICAGFFHVLFKKNKKQDAAAADEMKKMLFQCLEKMSSAEF